MGIIVNFDRNAPWIHLRRERQSQANAAEVRGRHTLDGIGGSWRPLQYGEYYAQSVPIYSAIHLRSTAVARPPLHVFREISDNEGNIEMMRVERTHPAQALLNRVNNHWTRGDLWRATETYLDLWGSSYWEVVKNGSGVPVELWALRPDKMRVVPDAVEYIKGYLYKGTGNAVAYAPDEIIRFNNFNPLEEFSGLSPIAPLRLSADMGFDALRSNRNTLSNDSVPGLFIKTPDTPTDDEVAEFYERWEERYRGVSKVKRPALMSAGMEPMDLGFSPKEMEYVLSLRWTLEDTARAYNIPMPMLHDLSRATYENIRTARRSFWEDCVVPQLMWYEERIQEFLLPMFGDPTLVVKFDLSEIEALQEDATERSQRHSIYMSHDAMTVNEVRADIGLPPVEWGDERPSESEALPFGGLDVRKAVKPRKRLIDDWERVGAEVEDTFIRQVTAFETSFSEHMRRLFNLQVDDALEILNSHRSVYALRSDEKILQEVMSGAATASFNGHSRQDEDPLSFGGLVLFDIERWIERFRSDNVARELFTKALNNGAQSQVNQFSLGIAWDVSRDIPQSWIADRLDFWANRVNQFTAQSILEEVAAAQELGEGVFGLARRLENVREVGSKVRAFRIARTEMVSAANEGHLLAYEQAEIPAKQWWTARDDRVRETHSAAHGQIRLGREFFNVGDAQLRSPGQGGPASEVVNCRCTTLPVFEVG